MSQALVNLVGQVPWQYFCTLTFGTSYTQKKTPNKVNRAFEWLRDVSEHHRGTRSLKGFRFFGREELGETGERFHYHFLLADCLSPTLSHCHSMAHLWREEIKVGYAVIRPYSRSLDGVSYCLKGLNPKSVRKLRSDIEDKDTRIKAAQGGTLSGHYSTLEANQYELGKYATVTDPMVSNAVIISHALMEWLESRVDRKSKRKARYMHMIRDRRTKHTSKNPVEKR